jgi:adenosyl cobinamide kinase/adenosyl cobinamide phosphate guanylyltransferase
MSEPAEHAAAQLVQKRSHQVAETVMPIAVRPPAERGGAEAEEERKRAAEHKKQRSKNWTRAETLKLIRLRAEMEPRFARSGRKSELWEEIAESLRRESVARDAQRCRDKWEKLTASYKEVRDGQRNRQDFPFFDELDPLLSLKPQKAAAAAAAAAAAVNFVSAETPSNFPTDDEMTEEGSPAGKRRKTTPRGLTATDLDAVRELLESLVNRQQRFFVDLLESIERKEEIRERIRQEKEEKWRAEERAQRCLFNNAMIVLAKKLVDGDPGFCGFEEFKPKPTTGGSEQTDHDAGAAALTVVGGGGGPKKRSKNWKRAEVLRLIKFRAEMESRFAKSARRAALWEELAELLGAEGIKRDGKQCREKWDKLMAEFKDVSDGKRDRSESPYYAELTATVGPGRSAEAG